MKLKFKVQAYQTNAVEAVVDCFAGQPRSDGISYRIDPGRSKQIKAEEAGFKNADLQIPKSELLNNIQAVQRHQNLPISDKLISSAGCDYNLDIEMETGTSNALPTILLKNGTILAFSQRHRLGTIFRKQPTN